MKCRDCGKPDYTPSPKLSSICVDCWEVRSRLVEAWKADLVDPDEFREVQRVIVQGNGQGASAIRRVLGLTAPEI